MYTPQRWAFLFCFLLSFFSFNIFAQVGIGTTNPNPNALLDIDASTTPGGLLLPRMNLAGTNSFAPLTGNVAGMVVYNTATAGVAPNDVTPGYYYNDGSQWVRIAAASVPSIDWTLTGNAGTVAGTNFLGTTDNVSLRFKTDNADRFEMTTSGNLRAFANGTAGAPVYSWFSDTNMGMFRVNTDILAFSTNGAERMRIIANGNVGIGSANARERLEVTGNFRLSGAFMPNNLPGTTDKILLSKGAGTAPAWGPGFLNTDEISNIGKYYVGPFNSNNNSYLALTVTDANMTTDTSIAYNFIGDLPLGPWYGYDLTINAESRDGNVIFYITNFSGYNVTNLQIVYTAFYN